MFFFQRGLFAPALHARLSSAKRHERDAPHRAVVEIVPVCPLGSLVGANELVSRARVGTTGGGGVRLGPIGVEKSGDPSLGHGEGWRSNGGAISLGAGGEGRQLRSAGWMTGDGLGRGTG